MIRLTLDQIRKATHGTVLGDPESVIDAICTDTRALKPGCLFIAICGENHDGHDHLAAAARGGAVAAMVQKPVTAEASGNLPLIMVDDTRKAMGRLANYVRRSLRGTVIAVAGSNGKTGTKHLIHAALSGAKTGTISPKSFNNDIGVPLAIFDADPAHDYLVLELGTNHPGEILNLTCIAEPDVAVITSIGAEHLEFFGNLEGVAKENAQIIAGLNPRGLLIVNGDAPVEAPQHPTPVSEAIRRAGLKDEGNENGGSPLISIQRDTGLWPAPETSEDPEDQGALRSQKGSTGRRPVSRSSTEKGDCTERGDGPHFYLLHDDLQSYPGRKITFGFDPDNDLHPTDIRCEAAGVHFQLDAKAVFVPLLGQHTAVNALAAIAVARHLGVDDPTIFAGLAAATGPEMRLQLQTAGTIRILNDAYNANPHSMRAGLATLMELETSGRRVAILGDMFELGETADRYHREVGRHAAACDLDLLVCVGEKAGLTAKCAVEAGMPAKDVEHYQTTADCAANIAKIVSEGDLVLLKGSRGMKLETVAAAMTALAAAAGVRRAVAARTKRVVRDAVVVVPAKG